MQFKELSQYFLKIENTSSRLEMTQIISDLFKKIGTDEIDKVLYLLQGRISPLYVKKDFGIGERLLIKGIVSALNIERKFFMNTYEKIGDLGKAVEYFRKDIFSIEENDLSISQVFAVLEKITTLSGDKSQDVKNSLLIGLIRALDPLSCRYIVRIPTNTLRLGFSDMTILDAFSWMLTGDKTLRPEIEKRYHVRPDIGLIGKKLKEKGLSGLDEILPEVFTPIIMMRAERMSSGEEIISQIGECYIESKYDGFRVQVHKWDDQVVLFSRSLEDVSYMYPDIVEGIKKQVRINEVILEGEAIGFNPQTGDFLPFQETVQRKRKYDIDEKAKEIPLKLFTFELLYADGKSYLEEPLVERRKKLERVIKVSKDTFEDTILVAPKELVSDPKKVNELFEVAIGKGLEGIIAKKLTGIYQAGARGWNWIKFKKSYSSKIQDTIDCVVMGYDFGKGKRTEFGMGAFLVGVYDVDTDSFLTIAKIGTGLTDVEWKFLKDKIDQQKLISKNKPHNYIVEKNLECDVWVDPQIVVEIKADEITKSPIHSAKLALRFPRLQRFRDDKEVIDITSLKELREMHEASLKN
jgi:DNA ligase-1